MSTCDLCNAPGRVTRAFLRRPWSPCYISVKACLSCSTIAWATCGDLADVRDQVLAAPLLALPAPIVVKLS